MRIIRDARENDLDSIRDVVSDAIRACVADSEEVYKILVDNCFETFEWWINNKERSLHLVCEDSETVSGVILVKEYWNLTLLFVAPDRHRSGIGRELIYRAMEKCRGKTPKGCLKLNSSGYAAPFYKKLGFMQTGEGMDKPGGCIPFEYSFEKAPDTWG